MNPTIVKFNFPENPKANLLFIAVNSEIVEGVVMLTCVDADGVFGSYKSDDMRMVRFLDGTDAHQTVKEILENQKSM